MTDEEVAGASVADVLLELERRHPWLSSYLVDERGSLRQHVSIFVGENALADRQKLSDKLAQDARLFIAQALSGG